jgi:hypothetical protein
LRGLCEGTECAEVKESVGVDNVGSR